MNRADLAQIIKTGESLTAAFESWAKAKDNDARIRLAVDTLIAFANAKGGTLYFGIEKDGEVTGCTDYDCQQFIEHIYDGTRPHLFSEIEEIEYKEKSVLAITVSADKVIYTALDGRCFKRLGKVIKPYYGSGAVQKAPLKDSSDFSRHILAESSDQDINLLEVYHLKERLKIRDIKSRLLDRDVTEFLRESGFIRKENGSEKLTVAGLLFVGKENSIRRLLPQAKVVYLHYENADSEEYDLRSDFSYPIITILEKVTDKIKDYPERAVREALLNAMAHRDYQNGQAVYVKHYPHKVIIENPGGFAEGITEKNMITHPSVQRNRKIAETLQRLKNVERTGRGVDIVFEEMMLSGYPYPKYEVYEDAVTVTLENTMVNASFVTLTADAQRQQRIFSLPELLILYHLSERGHIKLSEAQELIQMSNHDTEKYCRYLIRDGFLVFDGKEYTLAQKIHLKTEHGKKRTKSGANGYEEAKKRIINYLKEQDTITNEQVQKLCQMTRQQARMATDKMRLEEKIILTGKGRGAKYILNKRV